MEDNLMGMASPAPMTATPNMGMSMMDNLNPDRNLPSPTDTVEKDDIDDNNEGLSTTSFLNINSAIVFDDLFPNIELEEEEEKALACRVKSSLQSSVKSVKEKIDEWATHRAIYMLEYMDVIYPSIALGPDYKAGVLLENVMEGMRRMKTAVFSPWPLFGNDFKMSGNDQDIDFLYRSQWCMDNMIKRELKLKQLISKEVLFDFLMDGSAIVDVDYIYEHVPQRTMVMVSSLEELEKVKSNLLSDSDYQDAINSIQVSGVARVLVEVDTKTTDGMQFTYTNKIDHLIPAGVTSDEKIKFRAKRLYLTRGDLEVLSADEVKFFDRKKVEAMLGKRSVGRGDQSVYKSSADKEASHKAYETVREAEENELIYDWYNENRDNLDASGDRKFPYEDLFYVYKVTAMYGYATQKDPKGLIPKYVELYYDPETDTFLRAKALPHFSERQNYFHFKMGFAPNSYYGLGYGKMLVSQDVLKSNSINMYFQSAAIAAFNPFVFKHPDSGGKIPFTTGYGPAKIAYVDDPTTDFKQIDAPTPSEALIRALIPIADSSVSNRTSITPLMQGKEASSDPRAPAEKTQMLLAQASVGFSDILDDWCTTGWNPMADFIWSAMYELATFMFMKDGEMKETFGSLVYREKQNKMRVCVTVDELKEKMYWKSLASADYLNPEVIKRKFAEEFKFFIPMLREIAQLKPDVYLKYYVRWMQKAAQVMDVNNSNTRVMVPTEEELLGMNPQNLQGSLEQVINMMNAGGQSPTTLMSGQAGRGE